MWNLMPEELKKPALKRSTNRSANNNNNTNTSPQQPSIGCYSGGHVLVNMERQRRNVQQQQQQQQQQQGAEQQGQELLLLQPLQRSIQLDDLAKQHATLLTQQASLHHSVQSLQELQVKLQSSHVGENVQRGESIREMHQNAMQALYNNNSSNRIMADNILGKAFTECGMGTAVSSLDGKLYMVQLFRGGHWIGLMNDE